MSVNVKRFIAVPISVGVSVILVILLAATSHSQQCRPLLIPNKKTLFQRVVSHPGANLYVAPDKTSALVQANLKPFTVLYVYAREYAGDRQWLKVGPSSNCQPSGWINGYFTSEWRQSLTLVFTERSGRRPVLFFDSLESLEQVAASASPGQEARELMSTFTDIQAGKLSAPDEFPIMAMEPPKEAVSRQRFYLIPIFQTAELFEGVKFLEVASIDPGSWKLPINHQLRTAIVFVIDTTISMKPYIERTREAVRKVYDAIEETGLSELVGFGLVAFRSSTRKTPSLEYVSRVFSDIKDGTQREAFERELAGVREAKVSSHSFNEDALAGLKTAIEDLDWKPYQSRLIFLITDAGAIRNDDPFSTTGMNETEIADIADAHGAKVFVLHIRTPAGERFDNFQYAETQYRALTGQSDPTIGDLYVPIDAGTTEIGVRTFGRVVEKVASQMVELVRSTSVGRRLQMPERQSAGPGDVVADAAHKAAVLGYSMQLEYLGKKGDVGAPQVVTSWVSDMDLTQPDTPSFNVTVLLTKNQLSDLHQRLRIILDQAQRTKRTGARDFFQGILSAAAQISRDPSLFSKKPYQNLGQMGLVGEFLDDLPYRSAIMRLSEEDWYRMSVGEQQALVDDLKSKIRRYRQYHDDVDNWVSFGATDPGEFYYRVPLSMMP